MKRTIEISEEDYQFLTKLAIRMKTQKSRQTNFPLFCIYDEQEDGTIKFIDCFFSEDSMNAHLSEFEGQYNKPFPHVRSVAYNDEMSQLMKFVVSLDDLVLPEHNNEAYV
jgi:hypothetical protein